MPGNVKLMASHEKRGALFDQHGSLHPEDIAAIRHGGAPALMRRRLQDRAIVLEGHLTAALDAARAIRRRHGIRAAHGNPARVAELRAAALRSWCDARRALHRG